jgi:hypothetical protein
MATATELPTLPAWPMSPMSYLSDWWTRALAVTQQNSAGLAPGNLNQPILPGWTFGNSIVVNETNSSSPETERQVVAQDSYGRQLGRVIDALVVLINERPAGSPQVDALTDLQTLSAKIDAIKEQTLQARAQRLAGELAMLKRDHDREFQQVMEQVAKAPGVAPAQ